MKINFIILAMLTLLGAGAQAMIENDPNIETRIDQYLPRERYDHDFGGRSDRSVWECSVTDKRGRRWVGQHPNRRQACVVAQSKCIRNTSRKNCIN